MFLPAHALTRNQSEAGGPCLPRNFSPPPTLTRPCRASLAPVGADGGDCLPPPNFPRVGGTNFIIVIIIVKL